MKKKIVIVGGGIIGLSCAYYLSQDGHEVVLIDRGKINAGCSFGNAGMIVPSHVIPLAAPGMIAQGMRWMLNSKSPFYVKPRLNRELLSWGKNFYRSANEQHVKRSMPALRDLSLLSKQLYQDLAKQSAEIAYEEKGLLMLFQSEKVGEEEIHAGEIARSLGLEVDILSKEEVLKLESGTALNAIGGVHFKSDAHLYPHKLMHFLVESCRNRGVEFKEETEVQSINLDKGKIQSVSTSTESISGDDYVIAGGSWSSSLAKQLGVKLSLLAGKGYSFTLLNPEERPQIPSILCEGKVAVTPMGKDLRFGGTMEITHVGDTAINQKRLQGIVETANSFYPEMEIQFPREEDQWFGFRPCSPDGLPYIGRSTKIPNAIIATGHAMMGLSLGPATGKIVSSIIGEASLPMNIERFHPERRF
ncbi:MAG: NAD(P)/FAD-dependent oxidoreductase [Crocinitomicaceae bacterium]